MHTPYRAPAAPPQPREPWLTPDGLLAVPVEGKIPGVCLKCAARHDIVRRDVKLATGGNTAVAGGALGGVVGAVTMNIARNDPALAAALVVGALVVIGIVGWVIHVQTKRVALSLPLCRACDEAWSTGLYQRNVLLGAILLSGVGVFAGVFGHEKLFTVLGGIGFAVALLSAFVLRPVKRFITARGDAGEYVFLAGAARDVPAAIAARRAEKEARKRARETESAVA